MHRVSEFIHTHSVYIYNQQTYKMYIKLILENHVENKIAEFRIRQMLKYD